VPARDRSAGEGYIVMSFRFDRHPPYMKRLFASTDAICDWALAHGIRDLHLCWQVADDADGCRVLADRYRARLRACGNWMRFQASVKDGWECCPKRRVRAVWL